MLENFNDTVLPAWVNDEPNKDLPVDLMDFFQKFDAQPEFKVVVQCFNNDLYTGRPGIVGEWNDEIPNYESLVKLNGPKFYRYKFFYKDPGTRIQKKKNVDVDLTSKNWSTIAKEGENERKLQRREQIKEDMEDRNALLAYGGIGAAGGQSPQDAMKETLATMAPLLELIKGGNSDSMGSEKMMLFMMQMQQSASNQMMQMFGMMNKQNSELTTAMLGNSNGSSEKLFNMAERMINIKELISPKEEGLIEKVGNFIGNNIDIMGDLFAKNKEEREKDSGYKKVKKDWRFKKIKEKMDGNEAFAKKMIEHIDGKVGKEMTDQILDGFIKYKRKEGAEEAGTEEPVEKPEDEITEEDFEEENAV